MLAVLFVIVLPPLDGGLVRLGFGAGGGHAAAEISDGLAQIADLLRHPGLAQFGMRGGAAGGFCDVILPLDQRIALRPGGIALAFEVTAAQPQPGAEQQQAQRQPRDRPQPGGRCDGRRAAEALADQPRQHHGARDLPPPRWRGAVWVGRTVRRV